MGYFIRVPYLRKPPYSLDAFARSNADLLMTGGPSLAGPGSSTEDGLEETSCAGSRKDSVGFCGGILCYNYTKEPPTPFIIRIPFGRYILP